MRNEDNLEDSVLPFLLHPITDARGHVQFRQNLNADLFEKGESPCAREFPDVKTKDIFLTLFSKVNVFSHQNMESTQLK